MACAEVLVVISELAIGTNPDFGLRIRPNRAQSNAAGHNERTASISAPWTGSVHLAFRPKYGPRGLVRRAAGDPPIPDIAGRRTVSSERAHLERSLGGVRLYASRQRRHVKADRGIGPVL